MDLEYIESLAELVRGSRVTEVSVRRGAQQVVLRRQAGQVVVDAPLGDGVGLSDESRHTTEAALVPVGGGAVIAVANTGTAEVQFEIVKAHRVGVFHRAAEPAGEALIRVGDWAAPAQQLASIESMTLYDEVDSPVGGRIVGVFVADGDPVEYGQPLFHVEVTDGPVEPGEGGGS